VRLLWSSATTKRYLESLGGSLLSPIKDLDVNYGKYTDYLKPMLADLAVTPQWVAEDLARPELPAAPILHNAPVAMLLAVFDPRVALQKHYVHRFYP
jgi:hypothetical protein